MIGTGGCYQFRIHTNRSPETLVYNFCLALGGAMALIGARSNATARAPISKKSGGIIFSLRETLHQIYRLISMHGFH